MSQVPSKDLEFANSLKNPMNIDEGVRSREQIDQELGESSRQMECVCVLVFIVSLIQPRTTWEERASTEELLKSDWPVDKSVWNCLD